MADFKAGFLIVGLLLYFLVLFLVTYGAYEAFDLDNPISDPGFASLVAQYTANAGLCDEPETALSFLGGVSCEDTRLTQENACNNITGCLWVNDSDLFGFWFSPAHCSGSVDTIAYGALELSPFASYCTLDAFQDEDTCISLGCTWYTPGQVRARLSEDSTISAGGFVSAVRFLTGFNTGDLGIPAPFNWIFSFVVFYIPLLLLAWAIYQVIPFV